MAKDSSATNKTCIICQREQEASSELCRYHSVADENLRAGYEKWCYAYGELSWKDYLKRLLELPETGAWVKEVASWELKKYEDEKA